MTNHEKGAPLFFPPQVVIDIKAMACQLPAEYGVPLSHFTHQRLADLACERDLVASISGTTVWRWLSADAIKPWQHRSWIFPRDPEFQVKANRVLDLYHRLWDGLELGDDEFVISADEKTSIQARRRIHPTTPVRPHHPAKVEFEYERKGALAYFAAWDVHRAAVFGCYNATTGIVPFEELVDLVMSQEPYRSAKRVFWITDNGSSHRGKTSVNRLRKRWKNAVLVHLPVHASWLNQIEIYFSIVQRQLLTPKDFDSLDELKKALDDFQKLYQSKAKPFKWKFTKEMLADLEAAILSKQTMKKIAA